MTDPTGDLLEHANRGVRLQLALRGVLVAFVLLTIVLLPPVQAIGAYYAVVGVSAAAAAAFAWWAWPGGPGVARWGWLGLFADLVVLATLTLVAGVEATDSWTSYVLVVGFFVLPVLSATQLRPGVCVAVVVPTVAVYLGASLATKSANGEPWQSIALRTFLLAAVGGACVGLARIQRSRLAAIGALLADRTQLLDQLLHAEERERRALAERLHDGALQYVLAARLEVEDVAGASPAAADRIDHALAESSRLLRSTVAELHPAVLERAGLAQALQELAAGAARSDLTVTVDVDGWPPGGPTSADALLFGAARELLTNVVKHAGAHRVHVSLTLDGSRARLVVADDGGGVGTRAGRDAVAAGHLGLHSQALRVEAAGGTLTVVDTGSGTNATVVLPVGAAVEAS